MGLSVSVHDAALASKTRRGSRAFRLTMLAGFVVLTLGIATIFGQFIQSSREDVLRNAELQNENLRRIATRSIGQTIQSLDLSLQAAVKGLQIVQGKAFSSDLIKTILFDNSANADIFGAILVLDRDGMVKWDMRASPPPNFSRAERDYFKVHVERADAGLFISAPFRSFNRNVFSIALSRRISAPDGSFGGVVVGTINVDYFRELLGDANPEGGSSVLFRTDGTILMREPFVERELGKVLASSELMRRFPSANQGNFEAVAAIDGVTRLYSYAQVDQFPLIVSISSAKDRVLANWRSRTRQLFVATIALISLIVLLGVVLWRELTRRYQAERKLTELAADMEALARTDKLTGLANRRHFDDMLNYTWRRLRREGGTLTLLLLDVDHFKLFNDTFGHVEGDRALSEIASCISRSIRRPGDVAARYGGEEFGVILPNTPLPGALSVAETIQRSLSQAMLSHAPAVGGFVTVSVGVAVFEPLDEDLPRAQALAVVDAALYRAKAMGRNRIEYIKAGQRSDGFGGDLDSRLAS